MRNRNCWARALGDCSEKLSNEHRVSVAAWTTEDPGATRAEKERHAVYHRQGPIGRDGFSHIKAPGGFERTFTLKNLCIKALCTTHNTALSPLDTAAGQLTEAMVQFDAAAKRRNNPLLSWARKEISVNGPLLERWFLKTAITNCVEWRLPIGAADVEPGAPIPELVEMAFGLRSVELPFGLWGANPSDGRLDFEANSFAFCPWLEDQGTSEEYVGGCLAKFRGLRFAIGLDRKHAPDGRKICTVKGWAQTVMQRPFKGLIWPGPNVALTFQWPHTAESPCE